MSALSEVVQQLDILLPQLETFIHQFHELVIASNVNVITDSVGNMDIDVPANMSYAEADNVSKRLGIIDRLINTRGQQINELFQRGIEIERNITLENPSHVSYLTSKIEFFKSLNESYKH